MIIKFFTCQVQNFVEKIVLKSSYQRKGNKVWESPLLTAYREQGKRGGGGEREIVKLAPGRGNFLSALLCSTPLKFAGLLVSRDASGDRICAIERQIL